MQDNQQITEYFQKDYKKMVGYTRKFLRDTGERDAEDVIQDVMLSVIRTLDDIQNPIENMTAYLYSSIRNKVVEHYRKKKNKPLYLDDIIDTISGNTLSDILADFRYDTHNEVEKKEIRDRIFKAVDSLSEEQKAIWIATEIEEYTFEELSLDWKIPIGTLLARKHRAVLKLREKLDSYYKNQK